MPADMILSRGQVLRGRCATYGLLNALHAPTVFKAQVLEASRSNQSCKFMLAAATCDMLAYYHQSAVVKTALEPTKKALRRERNNYLIPGIRSNPYIRSQYDILECDPPSSEDPPPADVTATALPGMDHDLWQVPSERFRQNSILPKVISRSILSALALLKIQYDAIHTGWQMNSSSRSNS